MTLRTSFSLCAVAVLASAMDAQSAPVVDAHFHHLGDAATATALTQMDSMGVSAVVLMGTPAQLDATPPPLRMRLIKALTLPCGGGRMPNAGIRCYADGAEWPSLDSLRAMAAAGRVQMLGEINAQYLGVRVDDARLEPYLAFADSAGLPVAIHLGIGPPGVAYADTPFPPFKSPSYSGTAGDVMSLERVLVAHPKLKAYVAHAAWPFRDAMLYMLYMHPRLYVDVSVLQYAIPRAAYEDYLRDLVHAGFSGRILFGSDGNARRVREGIAAIRGMDFLTSEQKDAILGGNAKAFFGIH